MKAILVPTDFSANAEHALQFALDMAKKKQAQLILLHVYQENYSGVYLPFPSIPEVDTGERERAKTKMDEVQAICEQAGFSNYSTRMEEGVAFEVIAELMKQEDISLVIMGTKGHTGLVSTLFGSNAVKVMERASCPVMVIPAKAHFKELKRITYGATYNEGDVYALKELSRLALHFAASIHVLHITDGEEPYETEKKHLQDFEEKVKQEIPGNSITYQMMNGVTAETALEMYVTESPCDLLAMSKHQRSVYDRIFGTSITNYLAYHSKTPLMVFPYETN